MSDKQETVTPATEAETEVETAAVEAVEEESTLFAAPAKVEKPKPGKKRVLTLVVTLCVLLVLGGGVTAAYFGGLFSEKEETSDVTGEETEEEVLPAIVDYSETGVSAIEKLTVKNESGTYALVADNDGAMVAEGYDDLPRDATAVDTLLSQFTAVTPDLVIAEKPTAEQLTACGLDHPAITVTTQYTDGKTLTVLFGRLATGGKAGYYGMEKGGDMVWLFAEDYVQPATNDVTYYIGKTLMTAPTPKESDTVGAAKLKTLTLSGGDRADTVKMRYILPSDGQSAQLCGKYVLEQPFLHPADSTVTGEWDTSLCGLYGATIEAVRPTAADLEKFGLSAPRAVATLTFGIYAATDEDGKTLDTPTWYNEVSHTLTLGNRTTDDTYYAMVDGVDLVYTVNAATVPWAECEYEDLVNKSLFLRYITELSGINTTVNGTAYTLRFTHGTHVDEDDKQTETLKATVNGKEVTEGNARALYEDMMSVKRVAAAPADAKASGTPTLTIELVPLSGEPDTAFAFYPYSANRYVCVAANGDRFLVKAADVENLAAQLKALPTLSE